MTARHLGLVVISGLGLWLVMYAVMSLAGAAYFALSASPSDSASSHSIALSSLVQAALDGVGGAALIGLREPLSRWLFPGHSTIALPAETDFVAALLAVLGVYFVVRAIMDAAPTEIVHWLKVREVRGVPDYLRGEPADTFDMVRRRIWGVTGLAVGVALFVGSGSLARAWQTLRTAGRNREDPSV
jgi:hypothetical protein